jgi:hypothetical protein
MSYDSDFESVYMVEFFSGRVIYVQQFDTEEVKQYCAEMYPTENVKVIYKEVYLADEEDENDGQPDEMQEWHDFDPEC